jgi:PAS domain-containing protein
MITICAWCNKEISADSGQPDGMISHGICLECQDYFFPLKGSRSFAEFLDLLPVPVLVVDDDVRIITANKKARRLLGKKTVRIKGLRFGEAIMCPYARLPGGCGQTVHCRSCTVRLTIHDTYTTGQSHYNVPAYQDICFDSKVKNISVLISTEKSGEFVFVKIHEIKGEKCEQEKPRKSLNLQLRSEA